MQVVNSEFQKSTITGVSLNASSSLSLMPRVSYLKSLKSIPCPLPLFSYQVPAGFPSPADDYIERYIDLNAQFIPHPAATFLLKASGDSMQEAGIFSGDTLVVDRSIECHP